MAITTAEPKRQYIPYTGLAVLPYVAPIDPSFYDSFNKQRPYDPTIRAQVDYLLSLLGNIPGNDGGSTSMEDNVSTLADLLHDLHI